jgi:hypothetical protein
MNETELEELDSILSPYADIGRTLLHRNAHSLFPIGSESRELLTCSTGLIPKTIPIWLTIAGYS